MSKIIVITGASSGFGALTARALAVAGHKVYAGMRETAGRNAPQVASLVAFAKEHACDLRWVEMDSGIPRNRSILQLSKFLMRTPGSMF